LSIRRKGVAPGVALVIVDEVKEVLENGDSSIIEVHLKHTTDSMRRDELDETWVVDKRRRKGGRLASRKHCWRQL
jgi:hypothetical protein